MKPRVLVIDNYDSFTFNLVQRLGELGAAVDVLRNDAQTALDLSTQAQARFAQGEQHESEWRAWLIASRASEKLGDRNKSQEQFANAMNARSKLEQLWGADLFKEYSLRPDIKAFYQP